MEAYDILFNPSKSNLMYFNVAHADLIIYPNSQLVNVVPCETHLGNYIGTIYNNIYDAIQLK